MREEGIAELRSDETNESLLRIAADLFKFWNPKGLDPTKFVFTFTAKRRELGVDIADISLDVKKK